MQPLWSFHCRVKGSFVKQNVETLSQNEFDAASHQQKEEKEIVLKGVPVHVERIHIDGLKRTKTDVITKHTKDVFSATNFEEMVRKAQQAKARLESLGLFRSVQIVIDVSKGPKARKNGYEIVYDVREYRRLTGGISTLVGTNDGSLLFSVKMPNTLGRGEKINTEYSYGTKNSVGFGLNFTKPLQGDPNLTFQASSFQHSAEFPWSGYRDTDRGVATDLSFLTLLGSHCLRWEGVWRELSCLSRTTSFAVREQCGHSLKSSLKHTMIRDKRDNKVLPSKGYLVKLTQELAGLGGDANFVKNELELQVNQPLFFNSVLQMTFAGGIMKPIQPGGEIRLQDRFLLGGPLTLRGFNLNAVGPHVDGCAVGADTYWCSAIHLSAPLPFLSSKGGFSEIFRTHFFINAGNLRNMDFCEDWKTNVRLLGETLRWSYGAGIVLKMGGIARLELNYCWPMAFQTGDRLNPGLQFGIGVSFW